MLFLFLLKGLFKKQEWDDSDYMPVSEAEQPGLYAFVRRLCREVGAPFPYRIYLTPGVDAHVFYDTSLLNLVLPVRKNLAIGLGLLNAVTLNEFKAVLAHEFGHFAQTGMAIGNYAYVANRVAGDMVFGRDQFDDWVEDWREMDIRIAIFGWIFTAIIWVLRGILSVVYVLMNLAQFAMSRQMEFQADLVAVSVTGSDAIVHALSRLRFASEALEAATRDLEMAAHQGSYSRDLYYHQTRAMERLRKEHRDPRLGAPPPLPEDPTQKVQVFPPVEDSSIWSTHPSLYDREQNAKRVYIRSEEDGTSPWVIMRDPEGLRASLTAQVYLNELHMAGTLELGDPEAVDRLVGGAPAETTFDDRYHGLYDSRFIEVGDLGALVASVQGNPWPPQRLAQAFDRLYGGRLKDWMEEHKRREQDYGFLATADAGLVKVAARGFEFRGHKRRPEDVKSLLRVVEAELEEDRKRFAQIDQEVFLAHYQMALSLSPAAAQELLGRYVFHQSVQVMVRGAQDELSRLHGLFQFVASRQQLSEQDVRHVTAQLRRTRAAFAGALDGALQVIVPPLPDEDAAGLPLGQYLRPYNFITDLYSDTALPDQSWFSSLKNQLEEVQKKARHIHYGSLGAILAHQEKIAAGWRSAQAARNRLALAYSQSRLMSSAVTEWVNAPTLIRSTPASAMARTVVSFTPPDASVTARPLQSAAAWRRVSSSMLSSITMSAPASRASRTCSSVSVSTSILSVCGASSRARSTAARMLPAARMWLSLISTPS